MARNEVALKPEIVTTFYVIINHLFITLLFLSYTIKLLLRVIANRQNEKIKLLVKFTNGGVSNECHSIQIGTSKIESMDRF